MCLQNWVKPHRSFWYLFFVFPNLSTYTKHSLRLWRYSLLMSLYHLPSFTAYLDHLFPQIIILWDSLKIHITVWNYLASFTYELWRYQGDPPPLSVFILYYPWDPFTSIQRTILETVSKTIHRKLWWNISSFI